MKDYYFSYGSNMLPERLQARIDSARPLGRVCVEAHRLAWHKRGTDDSGKLDIVVQQGSVVEGVLYEIEAQQRGRLDAIEGPGYATKSMQISFAQQSLQAFTYYAIDIQQQAIPYDWYKALCLAGALQADCSAKQIDQFVMMPSEPDSDLDRPSRREALEILQLGNWHQHDLIRDFLALE